jgi:hypothetical protein
MHPDPSLGFQYQVNEGYRGLSTRATPKTRKGGFLISVFLVEVLGEVGRIKLFRRHRFKKDSTVLVHTLQGVLGMRDRCCLTKEEEDYNCSVVSSVFCCECCKRIWRANRMRGGYWYLSVMSFWKWNLWFQMERVLDEVSTRDFVVEAATTLALCRKNTAAC